MHFADLIDEYLSALRAVKQHRDRKERVLRKPGRSGPLAHPRIEDISLLSFLGNVPLTAITAADLVSYQTFLETGGYSSQSLRDFLVDARSLFNHAVRTGRLTTSPASALRLPPLEPSGDLRFLTPDQVRTLLQLAQTPAPPHGNLTSIAEALHGLVYLGLRRGELLALRWQDLDLQRRIAVVRGARKNPARRARKRAVPLPDPLLQRLLRRPPPQLADPVFPDTRGRPFGVESFKSALTRFRKRCRRELCFDFTPQVLRRTYGSVLYEAGYSLDQIAEFLGNSPQVCRQWYVSLRAEEHQERVTRAFGGE